MHERGGGRGLQVGVEALALAVLLLAGAGCGAPEQLYPGAERPDEQVAFVHLAEEADEDGFARGMFLTGVFIAVDGVAVEAESIEVLPGGHVLCVLFGVEGLPPTEGRLVLQARAGREYVVGLTADVRGPLLTLSDAATGERLDGTRVEPDEISPVRLDLSGEGWFVAHSANSCRDRGVTWLPEGEGFHDWSAQVNLYVRFHSPGEPVALDAALADRRRRLEAAGVSVETWTVISRDETSVSYHYRGQDRHARPGGIREGAGRLSLGNLRTLHCGYERRGELDPTLRADWLARFRAAGG